jgi:periplasmic divalent cation tolerance protein
MTAGPDDVCEVVITAPDEAWLLDFTRHLVEARLAACGHHTPIRSIYTWAGAVHDEPETRVALHTRSSCVPAIITPHQRAAPLRRPLRHHPAHHPGGPGLPHLDPRLQGARERADTCRPMTTALS